MRTFFKYSIWLLFGCCVVSIAYGFYLKNSGDFNQGEKQIGFGALGMTFVVMPLFIIYRYAKKDLSSYTFPGNNDD